MPKPPSGFTSPPDEQAWEKHGHRVTLLVRSTAAEKASKGEDERCTRCDPYGARARMILLYLQTQVEFAARRRHASIHRDRQLLR